MSDALLRCPGLTALAGTAAARLLENGQGRREQIWPDAVLDVAA